MAPIRKALHEDKELCEYLIKTPAVTKTLSIGESKIASLGSGLSSPLDIGPGLPIFKSKPLIACVDPQCMTICHYCLKDTEKMALAEDATPEPPPKACSGCRRARFCSRNCQANAWKLFHKDECEVLRDSPNITLPHLALYRILFWKKANKITDKVAKTLSLLDDHFDDYSNTEAGDKVFEFATSIRSQAKSNVALNVVLRLLPAIHGNAIKMRQAEKSGTFGIALDLLSCAINHSCDPNAFLYVEDGHIFARSIRQIPAGEEVTISYCDPMLPLKSRRSLLDLEYFFRCFCKRCESDKREQRSLLGHSIHSLKALSDIQADMVTLVNNTVVANNQPGKQKEFEDIDKMETCILTVARRALKGGNWPEHLDPMPLVRNNLAQLYLNKNRHLAATRNALRGALMCRYRTGPNWVNNLCTLTQCLAGIASASPDAPIFTSGSFLTMKETQTAVRGYGMRLCKDAGTVFGGSGKYTEAICEWYSWIFKASEPPKPGTKEFDALFLEVQKKLLAWADVDQAYGVEAGDMTSSSIEELCTMAMERLKIAEKVKDMKELPGADLREEEDLK